MAMGMTVEQLLDFNRGIIEEFRANGGKCGGRFEGNPMLLLTMTGARMPSPYAPSVSRKGSSGRFISSR